MIKSIPSFKESELESVILWNRILVYATLYGQAKKVSDVLKRYNIHLSNPSLDEFTYSAAPFIMMNNVNYLESYVSASDSVSSFSITVVVAALEAVASLVVAEVAEAVPSKLH